MKQPINLRFDKKLLDRLDTFIKTLIQKQNRTAYLERAAKMQIRRDKKELYRENQ